MAKASGEDILDKYLTTLHSMMQTGSTEEIRELSQILYDVTGRLRIAESFIHLQETNLKAHGMSSLAKKS